MNPRQQIQQMRRDVDALAARNPTSTEPGTFEVFTLAHLDDRPMKIRLRRLRLGEKRRFGDLWLHPEGNRLIPLVVPWWMRYGVLTENHTDHFRILP